MSLFINCPGCGQRIVNNGEDCPWCHYSMKDGKSPEELEQEQLAAEEARIAEEQARAAEEARIAQEQARAAEQARIAEEQARAAEEARIAEEQARAAEEARIAQEQARAAEQARIAQEQARAAEAARQAAAQRAAEQRAAEAARQAAARRPAQPVQGGSNIFAQFQQKTTAKGPQVDISDKVSDMDNLPEMPDGDTSALPPMQIDRPISIAAIANTPAVPLTPLEREQEASVLPPMQLEREVTMEEIANTPAVQLTEIKGEEINDALPDYNTYAAAAQRTASAVPQTPAAPARSPVQPAAAEQPAVRMPQPPVQQPDRQQASAQQSVLRPVKAIAADQPTVRMSQPTTQQPAQRTVPTAPAQSAPRAPQPPVQQPVRPQVPVQQPTQPSAQPAARPQPPMQRPAQQRQWSANPNEFTQQPQRSVQPGQPMPPQRGAQPGQPMPPQRGAQPGQPMPPQRGAQSGQPMPPQRGAQPGQPMPPQRGAQPGQPMPPQRRPQPGQPVPPQGSGSRPARQQRQWSANPNEAAQQPQKSGKIELQPIEQEVSEFTSTGERLENLPPQQAPSDPNFDTDSYVRNLQQQIKDDQNATKDQVDTQAEIIRQAENVQVQPMKFDGKQVRGATVNVVKAPRQHNKNLVPIIVVCVLVLALVGIAVYIFFFSGLFKKDANINFKKPVDWNENVYAVYYNNPDELKQIMSNNDKSAVEKYKMNQNGDGIYSITVPEDHKDGYVFFFTDDRFNKEEIYPKEILLDPSKGLKVEKEKTYEVTVTSPSLTSTVSAAN